MTDTHSPGWLALFAPEATRGTGRAAAGRPHWTRTVIEAGLRVRDMVHTPRERACGRMQAGRCDPHPDDGARAQSQPPDLATGGSRPACMGSGGRGGLADHGRPVVCEHGRDGAKAARSRGGLSREPYSGRARTLACMYTYIHVHAADICSALVYACVRVHVCVCPAGKTYMEACSWWQQSSLGR